MEDRGWTLEAGIRKSSRHQKIIGEFGEHLICNWLSRSGFEVARVDHTGIDLVAYNPTTEQRLGITVRSRTRDRKDREESSVNLLTLDDRRKLEGACKAFACEPWIGVYVETEASADAYLTSLRQYDHRYRGREGRRIDTWKMRKKDKDVYRGDPAVKHIKIDFDTANWGWGSERRKQ